MIRGVSWHVNIPVLHNTECPRFHAVDRPVGVALPVADGDAEAAVVGPHQVDGRPRLAVNVKDAALAAIARPPF
jgi:hypothetical protein